jgi:hypothetical protein
MRNLFTSGCKNFLRKMVPNKRRPARFTAGVVDRERIVPVVFASERHREVGLIQGLLSGSKWGLVRASSWTEVRAYCTGAANLLVLLDEQFQDSSWRAEIQSLPNHPAVILISDVSDPYLWTEFVRSGGFETLARPIGREELLRVLSFARRHIVTEWPQLRPSALS